MVGRGKGEGNGGDDALPPPPGPHAAKLWRPQGGAIAMMAKFAMIVFVCDDGERGRGPEKEERRATVVGGFACINTIGGVRGWERSGQSRCGVIDRVQDLSPTVTLALHCNLPQ